MLWGRTYVVIRQVRFSRILYVARERLRPRPIGSQTVDRQTIPLSRDLRDACKLQLPTKDGVNTWVGKRGPNPDRVMTDPKSVLLADVRHDCLVARLEDIVVGLMKNYRRISDIAERIARDTSLCTSRPRRTHFVAQEDERFESVLEE